MCGKRNIIMAMLVGVGLSLNPLLSFADSRIKDIVDFEGIRNNLLIGYGLVVGLNGTGDNLSNSSFTQQGLTDFLEKLGVNTRGANLKTKNVAAVTVTAKLPPFTRQGGTIDVAVSTIGDAKSLQGGTLLATPLVGADGEVYAVSQGQVSIGGFQATGNSGTVVSKGVSTNGFIPNGALIEREIAFDLASMDSMKLALKNPDITTSMKIAEVINANMKMHLASAKDPGTVEIAIPDFHKKDVIGLLAKVENLEVPTDQPARIVIDEASGTIVIGENVKISSIAIAQGNITITVNESQDVSQPNPFAPVGAATVTTPETNVSIQEEKGKGLVELRQNATLGDLVKGLNSLGVSPRDLITILENIRAAGALQAEIEAR